METRQQIGEAYWRMISAVKTLYRYIILNLFFEECRETNTRFPFFRTSLSLSDNENIKTSMGLFP